MKLKLYVDALYTDKNGIDEIMEDLTESLDFIINDEYRFDNTYKYGYEFKEIIIRPFCIKRKFISLLGWGDTKIINRKQRTVEIKLCINYERFITETFETKRLMFIDTIIKSIEIISENSVSDFKGKILIRDILENLNVKREELLNLNKRKSLF